MSAGYVASERLEEVRAHVGGRARVIPVAARPSTWMGTVIEGRQPLPLDEQARPG